jgi:peptide/nickel transport system permease protein
MQSSDQQANAAEIARPLLSPRASLLGWAPVLARAARSYPLGAFGGLVLLLLVLVAVLAPYVATHDPLAQDVDRRLEAPSSDYWLGSDFLGRDAYSRIVFGARVSLYVGLLSVLLGTSIGLLLGLTSGYVGGRFDLSLQRLVDIFMGFPGLIFAMILVVALGASINNVTLAIGITMTPRVVRLARGSALTVKEEVYILASQAIGASSLRILLRHVLPNSLAPVFVLATGNLGAAIISESGLSFLGLGVPPPSPAWGGMLNEGATGGMEVAPWLAVFPGLALSIVVFSFAFLGDALRDALDPRLRGR